MAYHVNNNAVTLTRGDSMTLDIVLCDGDLPYTPESGDSIRFALKKDKLNYTEADYVDDVPLILKTIDTATMKLNILPSDTKDLDFGNYVYDIELTKSDGTVDTFITASPFVIAREVH